jgi:hypothetical protein
MTAGFMSPRRNHPQISQITQIFFRTEFGKAPFVLLSIRKRIRLWREIALFDLSANEDRKVAVGFIFAPN